MIPVGNPFLPNIFHVQSPQYRNKYRDFSSPKYSIREVIRYDYSGKTHAKTSKTSQNFTAPPNYRSHSKPKLLFTKYSSPSSNTPLQQWYDILSVLLHFYLSFTSFFYFFQLSFLNHLHHPLLTFLDWKCPNSTINHTIV